jgi:hypothetical protein
VRGLKALDFDLVPKVESVHVISVSTRFPFFQVSAILLKDTPS